MREKQVECYQCPIRRSCSAPTEIAWSTDFNRVAKEEDCPLVKAMRKEINEVKDFISLLM